MTDLRRKTLTGLILAPILLCAPQTGTAQDAALPDPITTEAAELLDESGVLARQSRLGEGLLILEGQLRHAQAIERLVNLLGPDAMIEVSPGEFRSFADTPAGVRARIELMRLEQEYRDLIAPPPPSVGPQPPRGADSSVDIEALIERRLSEIVPPQPQAQPETGAPAEAPVPPISLREIYGSGTDLTAILQFGEDLVRVRAGDVLGRGVRVISVNRDGVRIERRGQEFLLSIPG